MKPWRCDPYLWVHLAGLATVPLWIDLCLLGLAVGNPTLPALELGVLGVLGVLPVLVMQLWRPFYIFSLPGLVLRPSALGEDRRRVLRQLRHGRNRLGALLVPLPLVWVLLKLYPLAFLARDFTPFSDWGRPVGVAIAIVGFALANLFLQVPVAVFQVLATPDRRFRGLAPYPVESIAQDFMAVGLPLGHILPDVVGDVLPEPVFVDAEPGPVNAISPTEVVATVSEVDPSTLAPPSLTVMATAPDHEDWGHPPLESGKDDIEDDAAMVPGSVAKEALKTSEVVAAPVTLAQSRVYLQEHRY